MNTTHNESPHHLSRGRLATVAGAMLLAAGVAIPCVATPALAAPPPAASSANGQGGDGHGDNGYLGVEVEVKNRTHSKVIYVKDRNGGHVKMIPGGASAKWAEPHKHAHDEVELATYYDHRVDSQGIELDGSNPKAGWPTFSVAGDVENFATNEMKVFNPGDGARYVVTRISDSADHKRFVVEVTPPGPIEKQEDQSAPATTAATTATVHQADHKESAPTTGKGFINTRGTNVGVTNGGDQPIWIQKFRPSSGWGTPVKLAPGEWTHHSGDYPVLDDCEMRAYFSEADARSHDNNVDIDAENPAGTSPWMSVDWDSEYFSVGGKHTWITDDGHRFDGERLGDSRHNKEFRLTITPR